MQGSDIRFIDGAPARLNTCKAFEMVLEANELCLVGYTSDNLDPSMRFYIAWMPWEGLLPPEEELDSMLSTLTSLALMREETKGYDDE